MNFTIQTKEGPRPVDARRFSHRIDRMRFWFYVHKSGPYWVISHPNGMRIDQFLPKLVLAPDELYKEARRVIDHRAAEVGINRFVSGLIAGDTANYKSEIGEKL